MAEQTAQANGYCAIELPDENLPKVFGNNGVNLNTITVVYWGKTIANPLVLVDNVTYVKTLTYEAFGEGTIVTNESQWIPQA